MPSHKATGVVDEGALSESNRLIQKILEEGGLPPDLHKSLERARLHQAQAIQFTARPDSQRPVFGSGPGVRALLDLEEPIRLAVGQACALTAGIVQNDADDPLIGAAEALGRALGQLESRHQKPGHIWTPQVCQPDEGCGSRTYIRRLDGT